MPSNALTRSTQSNKLNKGKVLGVKLGYNPNSSSLGVDVTFLLFGLSIITLLTPILGLLLRLNPRKAPPA